MAWTYDAGPPKEMEIDWDEAKIDLIAEWALKTVPDIMFPSTLRAITSAYNQGNDGSVINKEPVRFLAMRDNEGMEIECTVKDIYDDHGNHEGVLIQGSVEIYRAGVDISANNVSFSDLPASILSKNHIGGKIDSLIEFPLLAGRIIEDVKTIENNMLVRLNQIEPRPFLEALPGWQ